MPLPAPHPQILSALALELPCECLSPAIFFSAQSQRIYICTVEPERLGLKAPTFHTLDNLRTKHSCLSLSSVPPYLRIQLSSHEDKPQIPASLLHPYDIGGWKMS